VPEIPERIKSGKLKGRQGQSGHHGARAHSVPLNFKPRDALAARSGGAGAGTAGAHGRSEIAAMPKEKQDFARTQLTRGQTAWSRRCVRRRGMVEAVI